MVLGCFVLVLRHCAGLTVPLVPKHRWNAAALICSRTFGVRRVRVDGSSSTSSFLLRLHSSSSSTSDSSSSSSSVDSESRAFPLNGTETNGLHHDVPAAGARINGDEHGELHDGGDAHHINTNPSIMSLSPEDIALQKSAEGKNSTSTPTKTTYLDESSSILAIDPADVLISLEPSVVDEHSLLSQQQSPSSSHSELLRRLPFVSMFRGSANYIANHRNTVAVYHVPGGLLSGGGGGESDVVFRDLMNDVALTWLLGMKIVIVVGCRHQIEQRILAGRGGGGSSGTGGSSSSSNGTEYGEQQPSGLRVTTPEILRIVKEEAGYVRFEVERQLARSLRLQGGGTTGTAVAAADGTKPKTAASAHAGGSGGYYDGNVVSGNFYSAQPFGILDGVDYQYTGFVRRVEVEKIRQLHNARDICLLTTLGVSPSGEVFNVNSESLAATVAGAMDASKVVYFTERELTLRHRVHGNKLMSLRLSDARNLLDYYGLQMKQKGFVTLSNGDEEQARRDELAPEHMDLLLKIGWCTGAIGQGVKRAHIISPQHGALLQELYTRDGSGTLISADLYEGIRRATVLDVSAIHAIIAPLIDAGTLIDRPKALLEKDIDTYYIYTRDNHIIACGQLKKFEDGHAEIGCLVVNKDFRARGRGDAMLGYLERLCLLNGCTKIFVLSTQTMEWFVERGFDEAVVAQLPPSRQATYNHKRASKIYVKRIESDRDLDASELWWNR